MLKTKKSKFYKDQNVPEGVLNDYYIYADYFPPEKHEIVVDYEGKSYDSKKFYHMDFLVPYREGELPIKEKRVKKKMVLNPFNKNNSVFKQWKIDTNQSLKKAFELDIGHSKVEKFTGKPEIYKEVLDLLFKHTSKIKDIFTYGIGTSSYPSISWLDFSNMCQKWKLVDKNLTLTTIDRVFIVTNFEVVEQEDNPDRDLCRYEFYEIICRLAKEKYHNSKICDELPDAIEMLLNDIYNN